MEKNILIIGGTRFFGKLLVQRLLNSGHRVTLATRGLAKDTFGDTVQRLQVDRQNAVAMAEIFSAQDGYDVVYDQMCYTPADARISIDVFAGKVGRYVMSSNIETYAGLNYGQLRRPYRETDLKLDLLNIDADERWQNTGFAEQHYGLGKRLAEACLQRDGRLPVVSIRIPHVLAGPADFTGRLAFYVHLAMQNGILRHSPDAGRSSFTTADAITDFMCWAGNETFTGPINGPSCGELNAPDIFKEVGQVFEKEVRTQAAGCPGSPSELSPFDYPHPYLMDNARAASLGYAFDVKPDWLNELIAQHIAA